MKRPKVFAWIAGVHRLFWQKTEPAGPAYGDCMAANSFSYGKWALKFSFLPLSVAALFCAIVLADSLMPGQIPEFPGRPFEYLFVLLGYICMIGALLSLASSLLAFLVGLWALHPVTGSRSSRSTRRAVFGISVGSGMGLVFFVLSTFGPTAFVSAIVTLHETTAQWNLKTLYAAQVSYKSAHGVYASVWGDLTADSAGGPPTLSNPVWVEGGVVSAYRFTGQLTADDFTFTATPRTPGKMGKRTFTINDSGVISTVP